MINFYSETDFNLENPKDIVKWISKIIKSEGFEEGEISYIFCNDDHLHKLNVEFLSHDTLTDIISFDNSIGKQLHGDIYISTERVQDNAQQYNTLFIDELHRVIIHGVLHYCGYKDKTEADALTMRNKEDQALDLRNFI
jgi:probable rRNA maturation factor